MPNKIIPFNVAAYVKLSSWSAVSWAASQGHTAQRRYIIVICLMPERVRAYIKKRNIFFRDHSLTDLNNITLENNRYNIAL